jgi:hypothetical protein
MRNLPTVDLQHGASRSLPKLLSNIHDYVHNYIAIAAPVATITNNNNTVNVITLIIHFISS